MSREPQYLERPGIPTWGLIVCALPWVAMLIGWLDRFACKP